MAESEEIPFDFDALERLLVRAADTVLIGGQSLAFWVAHYGLPVPAFLSFISSDADLLGWPDTAKQIAAALGGVDVTPRGSALTALAGQVLIPAGPHRFRNVDVLHKVIGFPDEHAVRQRSLEVTLGSVTFRIMHPLDVLQSRVENLKRLPEKQTILGKVQAELAVDVVKRFIQELLIGQTERSALRAANRACDIAAGSAGLHVFVEYDVDVLKAVPIEDFKVRAFSQTQWPAVLKNVARLRKRRIAAKRNRKGAAQ
jgi:hypothetical protein